MPGDQPNVPESKALPMLHARLPKEPRAPALGRRCVGVLEPFTDPPVLDAVRLLVSELLTNSIKHSGHAPQPVDLTIEVEPDAVRVRVQDAGHGFRYERPKRGERGFGWGLYLVEELSDRWGVEPIEDDGTSVWFEIAR